MRDQAKNLTDGIPTPWVFDLGSPESRAAARAMLEQSNRVDITYIVDIGYAPGEWKQTGSYRVRLEDGRVIEFLI